MSRRSRPRPGRGGAAAAVRGARATRVPWLVLGAVAVLVVLAGSITFYALTRNAEVSPYRPSADNPDPSARIPGVTAVAYQGQGHVKPTQRVAYDRTPPFGGPHDGYWAACSGVVYDDPVRSENLVHSLEHGAVWIAYDPARIAGPALDGLRNRVVGQPYLALSPYPGLDQPVSLQSWGRQLKLDDPADPRLEQFIRALKQNPNTHPESGASCDALGPGAFDQQDPPRLDLSAPGPDAVPMPPVSPTTPGAGGPAPVPVPDSPGGG